MYLLHYYLLNSRSYLISSLTQQAHVATLAVSNRAQPKLFETTQDIVYPPSSISDLKGALFQQNTRTAFKMCRAVFRSHEMTWLLQSSSHLLQNR